DEHAFAGRQKDAFGHGKAGVDIEREIGAVLGLLMRDFFHQGFGGLFLRGVGLGGGVPINHRGGKLLPVGALEAVVADAVAVALVFADDLEAAVLEDEFFAASHAGIGGGLRGVFGGLRLLCRACLAGRGGRLR